MGCLNEIVSRCRHGLLWLSVSLSSISLPAWADLPSPPNSDIASGNNDWIDVGGNLAYKSLRYSCMIVGAMILIGAAFGIQSLSHVSGKTGTRPFFQTRRGGGGRRCDWRRIDLCRLSNHPTA